MLPAVALRPGACFLHNADESWSSWRIAAHPYIEDRSHGWKKPPVARADEVAACEATAAWLRDFWPSLRKDDPCLRHVAQEDRKRGRDASGRLARVEAALLALFEFNRAADRHAARAGWDSRDNGSVDEGVSSLNPGAEVPGAEALYRWFRTSASFPGEGSGEFTLSGLRVHAPPAAAFCVARLPRAAPLLRLPLLPRWQAILADPPWPNRSARRGGHYRTASKVAGRVLAPLRLHERASPSGCLVLVWVTNDPAAERAVDEVVFPAWQARRVGEIVWVKVSADGRLVVPARHPQRKPLERCLVGFIGPCSEGGPGIRDEIADAPPRTDASIVAARAQLGTPPAAPAPVWLLGERRVAFSSGPRIVAAVAALHSLKPPVERLLEPYLKALGGGPGTGKLELFARRLRGGWWCFGDQAVALSATCPQAERPGDERRPGSETVA